MTETGKDLNLSTAEAVASVAFNQADAMLKARENGDEPR